MLCKHLKEHKTVWNMNFNVSAKEALNTTVQRSQVQKQDDEKMLHMLKESILVKDFNLHHFT